MRRIADQAFFFVVGIEAMISQGEGGGADAAIAAAAVQSVNHGASDALGPTTPLIQESHAASGLGAATEQPPPVEPESNLGQGVAEGSNATASSAGLSPGRLVAKPPLPKRKNQNASASTSSSGRGRGTRRRPSAATTINKDAALQQFAVCVARDLKELNARFVTAVCWSLVV